MTLLKQQAEMDRLRREQQRQEDEEVLDYCADPDEDLKAYCAEEVTAITLRHERWEREEHNHSVENHHYYLEPQVVQSINGESSRVENNLQPRYRLFKSQHMPLLKLPQTCKLRRFFVTSAGLDPSLVAVFPLCELVAATWFEMNL